MSGGVILVNVFEIVIKNNKVELEWVFGVLIFEIKFVIVFIILSLFMIIFNMIIVFLNIIIWLVIIVIMEKINDDWKWIVIGVCVGVLVFVLIVVIVFCV